MNFLKDPFGPYKIGKAVYCGPTVYFRRDDNVLWTIENGGTEHVVYTKTIVKTHDRNGNELQSACEPYSLPLDQDEIKEFLDAINQQKIEQETEQEKRKLQAPIDIAAGLSTGVFCAGLFNPIDRALYLSVKNRRPFFSKENFKSPYHGFSQAVVQRAFVGGIYYTLQGEMKTYLKPLLLNSGFGENEAQFFVGMASGSMSGILTNGVSAVKYHTWGHESRTFTSSVRDMWLHGGIKPFFNGTSARVAREMVYGCTYEVLRQSIRTQLSKSTHYFHESYLDFACNTMAAGVGIIASGPFNYAMNIQYATAPHQKPQTISKILSDLCIESTAHAQKPFGRVRFFQSVLMVGPGTIRSAIGMAVGQTVFDSVRSQLNILSITTN